MDEGRAFGIHKPNQFFKEIVPLYFRQSRLSSFKRQLNLYGFELISNGPFRGAYFHDLFQRDRPAMCRRMRRVAVKVAAKKQQEEQKQREEERKAAALKREEERKIKDAENKLNSEVNSAKSQCFSLEIAVKLYTSRNQGRPPAALKDLLNPPGGLKSNVKAENLIDPWGKDYQYNPANKDTNGKLDPLVWTVHPKTGDRINASNRK